MKPEKLRKGKPAQGRFSAAFSGGPIEALRSAARSAAFAAYFPLLLAAAPLKPGAARSDARRRAAFSAAFSGGPIEA